MEAVQHENAKGPWDHWMNERSTGPKEPSERELLVTRCDNLANARA